MGKDQDLLEAARTGNVNMIEKLLSARPKNVLSQAIAIGFRRSVAPNCQDGSGYTPLHHAVLNGHKMAVEILLKYDAAPGMPDAKGSTPFHLAAWTGGVEIIHILMNHPRSYSQVNEQNHDWDTPLHFAAQYGHTDVVSTLLDNGADPTIYNKKEETPLDLAAQYGRLETAELLLHRRPELLAKISPQRSILHLASRNGHPLVIKTLLEAGCDINKKLKTGSALHEAALFGKVEAVRVLLQNNPPISLHIKDVAGETALQKVEGYPSKVAIEIAAMIKAFMKGDPLPPSMATPTPLRKTNHPIDAEQRSTYDNVPLTDSVVPPKHPRTPPTPVTAMVTRHSAYTPPPTKKQGRQYRPSAGAHTRNTNYQNLEIPAKVPPRKPARSSIGIMLMDKVDLSSSPKVESPLVNSSTSVFETSSMQQSKSSPQLRSPDKSPPPLPDRNYYDEDLAGEYTQLRVSAIKNSLPDASAVPSKSRIASFKCPTPPNYTPPGSEVKLRSGSAKHRNVYASNPTDEPFMSTKEDVNEIRKSLNLEQLPTLAPTQVPTPAPRQSSSVTPRQSTSVTPRQSESVYEDLSEAYSGNVNNKLHQEEVVRNCSTIGSSTGSDLDIDVYELLSEATTGQNDDYDIPPPRLSHSPDKPPPVEQRQIKREIPIPPPRRSKQGSSPNSHHPTVLISQKEHNGSYPLSVSATNSYYSDFPSSETDDSDMPSSPGSYYSQLPTPDHPPPSPHTAMLGIQAKLSPQSFPLHGTPRRESSNEAWMQPASPDHKSAFISLSASGQRTTETADLSESNLYLHSKEICLIPGGNNQESCELPNRAHYEKNANARKYHHPEKPNRFTNRTSSNGSAISQRTPTNHQSPRYNALGRRFVDKEPVNGQHYHHSERYSDGYQANDEFLSTDTSSNGDTELLRPDEEDPFAGLIYGSNRGSRNLSLENSSRFSFSHMADWSLASSTRTSMLMENGLLDVHVPEGVSRGHENRSEESGIDEKSEWAQIESIMASFGAGLVRESVYVRDFQKEFEKMFEGPLRPQSVGAWLENLGMGQYENMMIANGFDNLDFMGGKILEENDLIEMGIMEELHRNIILQATNALPIMKTIDAKCRSSSSVSEWLRSLLLSDCIPNFIDNGIITMDRAMELWEVELENVLEVHMLGHRKRILASLGDRRQSFSSSSGSLQRPNSLELTTSDLQEMKLTSFEKRKQLSSSASEQSASLDIDLFKDYSKEVTTPTKPRNFQTSLSVEQGRAEHPPSRVGEENGQRAARQISTVEDYDNIATTRRGSGSEEGEENTPTVQWMHPPEALIKGCCNYTASYLGSTLVKEVKGIDSTQESCTKLRRSASHLQKVPSITLSISYVGVKFIDFKSKLIITEHEICNISCVTQDSDDLRTFAYITKDSENEKLYCHVFSVKGQETSTEIILTLGQAFEIAYQMLLKSRPMSNEINRHPSNTSDTDHDTKL
ncbi:ankyrin repeat and sterile alpha motif domain-containing protein 1B-like isoform X1 [Asterias amurensis]|uniref:ankyrin repeat and sterile alpha motif domain-containing protein 1B-like isoform X1 n=2 Tax=Asterias amurensis TaxID=7602 RepID=UPI003AB69C9B